MTRAQPQSPAVSQAVTGTYLSPRLPAVAAAIAGSAAFILTQLLLGLVWGAGSGATFFSSVAFAVAAAIAAMTMKRGMAVVYGFLATFGCCSNVLRR